VGMSDLIPSGAHEVWMCHRNRCEIDSYSTVHTHPFTTAYAWSTGADQALT
jgi:hypothetical protein